MLGFDFLTDPEQLAAFVLLILPLIIENWPWLQQRSPEAKRLFAMVVSAVVAVAGYGLAILIDQRPFSLDTLAILILAVGGIVLVQFAFGVWRLLGLIKSAE